MRNVFHLGHSLSHLSYFWNKLLCNWKFLRWSYDLYRLCCFMQDLLKLGHPLPDLSHFRDELLP